MDGETKGRVQSFKSYPYDQVLYVHRLIFRKYCDVPKPSNEHLDTLLIK